MIRSFPLALALLVAAPVGAQDAKDEDAAEERAKERLKVFKEGLRKCREASDFVNALSGLGSEPHPLILAELKLWLAKPAPEVRMAASEEIAKFKKDEKAARTLVSAARAERALEVIVRHLRSIGRLGSKKVAKDLVPIFDHKETAVAKEAIDSSGILKSRDSIEPLISLIAELELQKDKTPKGGYVPDGPLNDNDPSRRVGGTGTLNRDEEKRQRIDTLLPAAVAAMKHITGERSLNTAKEWKTWWAKNKPFFKDEEEKNEKQPKP